MPYEGPRAYAEGHMTEYWRKDSSVVMEPPQRARSEIRYPNNLSSTPAMAPPPRSRSIIELQPGNIHVQSPYMADRQPTRACDVVHSRQDSISRAPSFAPTPMGPPPRLRNVVKREFERESPPPHQIRSVSRAQSYDSHYREPGYTPGSGVQGAPNKRRRV